MRHQGALQMVLVGGLLCLVSACGWFGGRSAPAWIDGVSREHPADQYLTGIGQADTLPAATERAYGAVAKIFKAEVTTQSRDWESFLLLESRGQSHSERQLTLDQVTSVSTDKVLENVTVLDTWFDRQAKIHYVMAGMNRAQATTALQERIVELDRTVESQVNEARQAREKLARVQNLHRAAKNLVLREAYNTDLRVIRTSGQGLASKYRVAELTAELQQFLATNLAIAVEVTGEQAEPVRRAVMEGLVREGLPVTTQLTGSAASTGSSEGPAPELLAKGTVRVWEMNLPDPRFRYVRWCSDFVITEQATQRVIGAVSKSGREGHLTYREATAKAVRVMEQEVSNDLAKTLAGYVYGETESPAAIPPAACPDTDGPTSRSPSTTLVR